MQRKPIKIVLKFEVYEWNNWFGKNPINVFVLTVCLKVNFNDLWQVLLLTQLDALPQVKKIK